MVRCTILTKITKFMRVLRLHNSAKFGCFISINYKTIQFTEVNCIVLSFIEIKTPTPVGRFQPNFQWP